MIEKDIGRRRRAFRLLEGELEFDLCARRGLEKQERFIIKMDRGFWPSRSMGTYNKVKSGYGSPRATGTARVQANRLKNQEDCNVGA